MNPDSEKLQATLSVPKSCSMHESPDEMAKVIVEKYLEGWAAAPEIGHDGVTENI